MTREENIRAILETIFSGYKDELIDIATKNICKLKQEPKTGQWIKSDVWYRCSECSLATNESGKNFYRYCPNCGSRMSEVIE